MSNRQERFGLWFSTVAGVGIVVWAMCAPGLQAQKGAPGPSPTPTCAQFPTPPPAITVAQAQVPANACGTPTQSSFDLFSWLSFVALNWPADNTCGPNLTSSILTNSTSPRVWETYLQDADVFVAKGATPAPWCGGASGSEALAKARLKNLPANVRELSEKTGVTRFVRQASKISSVLLQKFTGVTEVIGGPLVDQNKRFARFEIRMNQDEYNYLVKNTLWSAAGQAAFRQPIAFPVTPTGAIELKAAWKVLGNGDDPKTFYSIKAITFSDSAATCNPAVETLGLVGLHIVHKTASQPKWVWSTFEHVANAIEPNGPIRKSYSFANPTCARTPVYNPAAPTPCAGPCCPPNSETSAPVSATPCPTGAAASTYVERDSSGKLNQSPAQVLRVIPIDTTSAVPTNLAFQKLLAGTVWANYQLISTQWFGEFGGSIPKPAYLANTTIETFNQGPPTPTDGAIPYPTPGYKPFSTTVSSSCVKCHSVAGRAATPVPTPPATPIPNNGDFSFLLGTAQ